MLTIFVIAQDHHRIAAIQQAKIDEDSALPLLAKGKDGAPIPSPYLRVLSRTSDVLLRVAAELGFTPIARTRLAGPVATLASPDSPWRQLRLLQGGKTADDEPPPSA
jgi:hypothetical protein